MSLVFRDETKQICALTELGVKHPTIFLQIFKNNLDDYVTIQFQTPGDALQASLAARVG